MAPNIHDDWDDPFEDQSRHDNGKALSIAGMLFVLFILVALASFYGGN